MGYIIYHIVRLNKTPTKHFCRFILGYQLRLPKDCFLRLSECRLLREPFNTQGLPSKPLNLFFSFRTFLLSPGFFSFASNTCSRMEEIKWERSLCGAGVQLSDEICPWLSRGPGLAPAPNQQASKWEFSLVTNIFFQSHDKKAIIKWRFYVWIGGSIRDYKTLEYYCVYNSAMKCLLGVYEALDLIRFLTLGEGGWMWWYAPEASLVDTERHCLFCFVLFPRQGIFL